MVALKREGTGESVINLVRVQLKWKDRLGRVERDEGHLLIVQDYSCVCASRGVALGGRSASWK